VPDVRADGGASEVRYERLPGESILDFDRRSAKATEDDVVVLDADMFSEAHRCRQERFRGGWWYRCLDGVGHGGRCEFSKVGKHHPDHEQEKR
jgi:hypothetical protein